MFIRVTVRKINSIGVKNLFKNCNNLIPELNFSKPFCINSVSKHPVYSEKKPFVPFTQLYRKGSCASIELR